MAGRAINQSGPMQWRSGAGRARGLLLLLMLLACACRTVVAAPAQELITSRAFLEDPDGRLTVAEVERAPLVPMENSLAAGYSASTYWIRLVVRPPAGGGEVALRISPSVLDEVRLYEKNSAADGAVWRSRVTGDLHPYVGHERTPGHLGFVIRPASPQQSYYLRLSTSSTALMNMSAIPLAEAGRESLMDDAIFAALLAILMTMLFWVSMKYLDYRDDAALWFIAYLAVFILVAVIYGGYLAPLVPQAMPQLGHWMASVLICVAVSCSALFCHALLRPYEPWPAGMRLLLALAAALPVELLLMMAGYMRVALQANAMAFMVMTVLAMILSFTARREAVPGRRILRIVLVTQSLGMLLGRMPALFGFGEHPGERPLSLVVLFLLSGLVTATVLFVMLHLRDRGFRRLARENAAAVAERSRQLSQLNVELAHRIDESEGAARAKTAFLARVSHELRTPLGHVAGGAQLLRDDDISAPEREQYLDIIEQGAGQLRKVLDDILAVAEGAPRGAQAHAIDFSVRDLVAGVCASQWGQAEGRGLAMEVTVDADVPPFVHGDAAGLNRALLCLVENAIKFTSSGGVRVFVRRESGTAAGHVGGDAEVVLRFEVCDSGPGVTTTERETLFDAFEQSGDVMTRTHDGLGLGLAIAKQQVAALGGEIGVDSEPGRGSTFWFTAVLRPAPGAPREA